MLPGNDASTPSCSAIVSSPTTVLPDARAVRATSRSTKEFPTRDCDTQAGSANIMVRNTGFSALAIAAGILRVSSSRSRRAKSGFASTSSARSPGTASMPVPMLAMAACMTPASPSWSASATSSATVRASAIAAWTAGEKAVTRLSDSCTVPNSHDGITPGLVMRNSRPLPNGMAATWRAISAASAGSWLAISGRRSRPWQSRAGPLTGVNPSAPAGAPARSPARATNEARIREMRMAAWCHTHVEDR